MPRRVCCFHYMPSVARRQVRGECMVRGAAATPGDGRENAAGMRLSRAWHNPGCGGCNQKLPHRSGNERLENSTVRCFQWFERPENSTVCCFQWFERPENSTVCCFQRERAGRPTSNGPAGPRRWGRQAHVERAGRPVENGRAQRGIGHPTANICRMAPPSPTDAGHVQLTKSRIATSTPLALSRNGIDRGTMPCPMSNHCGKIPAGPTWQSGFTASKKPEGLQS